MDVTAILSIVNGAILAATAATGFFGYRAINRKTVAEGEEAESSAADKITASALKLLEPLNKRIDELQAANERLTSEVRELRQKVERYIENENVYQAEIEELERTLEAMREERETLRGRVAKLERRLHDAGINGE